MGMMLLGHLGGLALEQRAFSDLFVGFSNDSTELFFMTPLTILFLSQGQSGAWRTGTTLSWFFIFLVKHISFFAPRPSVGFN